MRVLHVQYTSPNTFLMHAHTCMLRLKPNWLQEVENAMSHAMYTLNNAPISTQQRKTGLWQNCYSVVDEIQGGDVDQMADFVFI